MIKSWKNAATRRLAEQGKSSFGGLNVPRALARLQLLDAMATLQEVPALGSVGLHKLKGKRRDQWAMTINGPWRLVFTFRDGNAHDVEIVDYH